MFWRLSCHFCGKRSKYSKGTQQFQCANCEAFNFFDPNGDVIDTPHTITNLPPPQSREGTPFETFTRPPPQRLGRQGDRTVCQRCLSNQQMYIESLNNYLPDDLDEDDPEFREYMKKLPQKKADLERKYPQVCRDCASKVQERIHNADYYGMSQQASINMRETSKRRARGQNPTGLRDDWGRWRMRVLLNVCGMMVYCSLLVQAAWHTYGAFSTVFTTPMSDDVDDVDAAFVFPEFTPKDCVRRMRSLRFDTLCYEQFASLIPKALLISFLLLWYNPGLKAWYHATYRIEAVHGQGEYFRIQVFMLMLRMLAWWSLSKPSVAANLTVQQLLAAHGFTIAFMIVGQWISERPIRSDKWRIKGKIMPKPSEQDVFGATAGPADAQYTRLASSTHPLKLFARDERPFPIENLAPKPQHTRGYSRLDLASVPLPSPPGTQSDSDGEDAMDIDLELPKTTSMPGAPIDRTFRPKQYSTNPQQNRSIYNYGTTQPSGWGAMRSEVYGLQDQMRAEEERKRTELETRAKLRYQPVAEQSPFRGRLPQAPMSMGRRLRNPPTQLQFKQTPLSKQQDFMKQMRESFEQGRTFGPKDAANRSGSYDQTKMSSRSQYNEEDEDFSPAKSRTRGALDLKPGSWHLPGDGLEMTGLEDIFGGKGFGIADEPVVNEPPDAPATHEVSWVWVLAVAAPILIVGVAWNIIAIRRPFLLWLVGKMDDINV